MNQLPLAPTPYLSRLNSLQITAIYALLGALWVPITDQLLAVRISDMAMFTSIQTLKDGIFVIVTAAMLYLLIQRSTRMLRHSEQVLREKHAQLNAIIEGSSDAIFIKDIQGRYLMINTAGTRYLAKPRQAILGKKDGELVSPDLVRLLTEKDRQVIANGETLTFEQRFTSSKATQIYSITKSPYQDTQGRTIGMIGIARNITKRKQREMALRQQAQIIDQGHDSVVSTDLDGYVTSWNKGAERLFGYQAEEMLGKPIAYVYPQEEHEFLERQVIAVLKEKGQHTVEVRMLKKSGEDFYAHLSLSLLLDDKGSATGMIGYSIDITERKRMEEALRISEERFRVALKNSPIMVFNQDDRLRYTWINKPMPGFSAQQILNRRDADFMERPEDAETVEKIKWQPD